MKTETFIGFLVAGEIHQNRHEKQNQNYENRVEIKRQVVAADL